eukprot:jgi/Ulvmu1/8960/UM005_0051.1
MVQFGDIVSIKLPTVDKHASKGMAYVQFTSKRSANAAIQASKEKKLSMGGATVVVAPYLSYQQRAESQEESFTNVYVKNLPSNILTNEELKNMFSSYGSITSARLVKVGGQAHTQLSGLTKAPFAKRQTPLQDPMFNRYYGFVNFSTPEAALQARNSLNGVSLGGGKQARLYVARFQNKAERKTNLSKSGSGSTFSSGSTNGALTHGQNVYVKHLAPEVDETILYQVFQA